ncbi:DNA-damage inducible protein 2-related protein [Mitosporidium daphniae]|uniref:DNA-damage inducible protein 2-related protein n=1 Tax=Mitosporidium daphniae TaxID=1485682 RepID=A0A098VT72_9MICR|nr:DNA-damage inducible protein 2-related protein [Mitosporidium daphniae]KGG52197.1 DNA-damage inducible protein 2-related protein [Mitosporidium daphniae]|eukprot:XP_013238624.1 DNA-damage inducible protein 2-related protein [Mitosporidium daphniae]
MQKTGLETFHLYLPDEKKNIELDDNSLTVGNVFKQNITSVIGIIPPKGKTLGVAKQKKKERLSSVLSNELSTFFSPKNPQISTQDQNLYHALEHFPESFGRVVLLFIKVSLAGSSYTALIDTGAQASIICSSIIASNHEISKAVDKRFFGTANGVGQSKILGKVHSIELILWQELQKKEAVVLPCGFHVMDMTNSGKIEIILGLDMLKRHQVILDLGNNCLSVHGYKIKFLSEWELPDNLK